MPHYDPLKSTTHDVVRCAIIPLCRSEPHLRPKTLQVLVSAVMPEGLDHEFDAELRVEAQAVGSGRVGLKRGPAVKGGRLAQTSRDASGNVPTPELAQELVIDEFLYLDNLVLTVGHDTGHLRRSSRMNVRRTSTRRGPVAAATLEHRQIVPSGGFSGVVELTRLPGVSSEVRLPSLKVEVRVVEAGESNEEVELPKEHLDIDLDGENNMDKVLIELNNSDEKKPPVASHAGPEREEAGAAGGDAAESNPEPLVGFAYATVINRSQPVLADKMVTHGWGNKFCHLVAAIVADALQEPIYEDIAVRMGNGELQSVYDEVDRAGKLDFAYWVCAFCVNQHAGICGQCPKEDSLGVELKPCPCTTEKHFTGEPCEMNKFDDMMNYLKWYTVKHGRDQGRVSRFGQVVAVDLGFVLLTRIWCIAELVEAERLHIEQCVVIHSMDSEANFAPRLKSLDVRDAEASYEADKELVLRKIHDVDEFNKKLLRLLLRNFTAIFANFDDIAGAAVETITSTFFND